MAKIISLNEVTQNYIQGNLTKKEFEEIVFKYILKHYHWFHLDPDEDRRIDYLCWLYPRISHAIDMYQITGASFESYIKSIIRWTLVEYHVLEQERTLTEQISWIIHAEEIAVCSSENEYITDDENEHATNIQQISNPQQILLLMLKSYYFISDDFLDHAAPVLGMKAEKLHLVFDKMRELRIQHDEKTRMYQERVYSQYYLCLGFEKRIASMMPGSVRREKLQKRLERTRERFINMKKRFSRVSFYATNQQIADVLGAPKGTVDSSLFTLKHQIKKHGIQ
jgi:hypothetical protein